MTSPFTRPQRLSMFESQWCRNEPNRSPFTRLFRRGLWVHRNETTLFEANWIDTNRNGSKWHDSKWIRFTSNHTHRSISLFRIVPLHCDHIISMHFESEIIRNESKWYESKWNETIRNQWYRWKTYTEMHRNVWYRNERKWIEMIGFDMKRHHSKPIESIWIEMIAFETKPFETNWIEWRETIRNELNRYDSKWNESMWVY